MVRLDKKETVALGLSLGIDYGLTWSCYDPRPEPCGVCGACVMRERGL